MSYHYFASNGLGWAIAETRMEALEKLAKWGVRENRTWLNNCHKDGLPGVYFWSCKVHAPSDENYKIEHFAPAGVEKSEPEVHYLTYLTAKKAAFWKEPKESK